MRVIFFKWGNYDEDVILEILKSQGHFVTAFDAVGKCEADKSAHFGANSAEYELESLGGMAADEMVSNLVLRNSDFIVKIPMLGHVNSLNASVATGILLAGIRQLQK